MSMREVTMLTMRPRSVMEFGATHSGTQVMAYFHLKQQFMLNYCFKFA